MWNSSYHPSENAAALRWLLEHRLVDEAAVRRAIDGHIVLDPAGAIDLDSQLGEHARYGANLHRVGRLVVMHLEASHKPMLERAVVAELAVRDLLRVGSPEATALDGICGHYEDHDSEPAADQAAQVQLSSAANIVRSAGTWDADPAPRMVEQLGTHPEFLQLRAAGWAAVALSVVVLLSTTGSIPEPGSGWRVAGPIIAACLLLAGILWLVRRPGIYLSPHGITIRTFLRTRSFPWSEVTGIGADQRGVDSDDDRIDQLIVELRDDERPSLGRTIRMQLGPRAWRSRDEIRAYATAHGARFSTDPQDMSMSPRWGLVVSWVAGAILVLFVLPWGFGITRTGADHEGWVIAQLASEVSTDWVEASIEEDLEGDGETARVRCPDRVPNDPSRWQRCIVGGIDGIRTVEFRFTSRQHDEYEYRW